MANHQIDAREKYVSYLADAIDKADTNCDGNLSHQEFEAFRRSDKDPSHKEAAAFVEKHFGTLSILSGYSLLTPDGITRNDIDILHDNTLSDSRQSYQKNVSGIVTVGTMLAGVGVGTVAEAADFAYTGGVITGCAVLGTALYAAYSVRNEKGSSVAMTLVGGGSMGSMWGPIAGTAGGYYAGHAIGNKMGGSLFDRKYKPEIEAMLKDLR